jgi:hypothetical protein
MFLVAPNSLRIVNGGFEVLIFGLILGLLNPKILNFEAKPPLTIGCVRHWGYSSVFL